MKSCHDKSQLRPSSDERFLCWPAPRHSVLGKPALLHGHTALLPAAQGQPREHVHPSCSLLLKPCFYNYREPLHNEGNVCKQLAWKSLFGWALSENSEGSACCCSRGSSPAHSPWEQVENETPNVSWKRLAPLCCSLSLNCSCSHSKYKLEASFSTEAAQKIPFPY